MQKKRGETDSSSTKEAISSKKLLGQLTHNKIAYYLNKNVVSEIDLYIVFKEFFKELLEIKKEFTCSELLEELDKVYLENSTRNELTYFIQKVSQIEYKDDAYTSDQLKNLFKDLDSLVTNIIHFTISQTKQPSFFSRFLKKLSEIKKPKEQKPTPKIVPNIPVVEEQPVEKKTIEKELPPEVLETKGSVEPKIIPKVQIKSTKTMTEADINNLDDVFNIEAKKPGLKIDPNKKIGWTDDLHSKIIDRTKKDTDWNNANNKSTISNNESNLINLITKAKKASSKTKLKQIYTEMLSNYNNLEEKTKKKYYTHIHAIFEKLSKK